MIPRPLSPRRFQTIVAIAMAVYAAVTAYFVTHSLAIGDGMPIYYLDDAYIHFAMARNRRSSASTA